ncbi:signal peptidase I [Flavobacteriaceae bacterium S356]|uniref:Signal peptidase I n=1 Tax=Asprobacillus argus TaxID=3076534 RepID=A0ABU3LIA2_9FLAO|nr:signal peptidase I [Flavobacteriaceae bacterium S356]
MTFTEWLLFFLGVQLIHFFGTWKLYQRAGRKPWEALIPIYNGFVLMEIIKRPRWWILLLFIPIVNLLMFPIIWIETARSFGFLERKYTILTLITFGLFSYYISYGTEAPYRKDRALDPRTPLGEWVSSIAFAIIAATMVHTYFMQPYTIPSSSLEKTLLVGDYLFVSKFHYGARVPMTTVAAPMLHDTLPIINKKSYLYEDDMEKRDQALVNKLQLPYMRLPGFQKIKRNDIVVFSWPADTVHQFFKTPDKRIRKPIDKRSNYVKRCVGIPGDSLSVIDGFVYINGKQTVLPDRAKLQFFYTVYSSKGLSTRELKSYTQKEFGREYVVNFTSNEQIKAISPYGALERIEGNKFKLSTSYKGVPREVITGYNIDITELKMKVRLANLTTKIAEELRKNPAVDSVVRNIKPKGSYNGLFPQDKDYKWSQNNFGPIYIPEAGKTVALNAKTIPFYEKIIGEYEHNDLLVDGENIYINGLKTDSYTFKQDYYWMMGDNRDNSEDSRTWGYVPFDHVVGKPVMVWFSWDTETGSIRWDRMFTTVGGNGELVSYRYLVFALILSYIGYSVFRSRRKKKA